MISVRVPVPIGASVEQLEDALTQYKEFEDKEIVAVATFTLAILHGGEDHKRWLLNAAFNFIEGEDVYDGNEFKK